MTTRAPNRTREKLRGKIASQGAKQPRVKELATTESSKNQSYLGLAISLAHDTIALDHRYGDKPNCNIVTALRIIISV